MGLDDLVGLNAIMCCRDILVLPDHYIDIILCCAALLLFDCPFLQKQNFVCCSIFCLTVEVMSSVAVV